MNDFTLCKVLTIISEDEVTCMHGSISATQATEPLTS